MTAIDCFTSCATSNYAQDKETGPHYNDKCFLSLTNLIDIPAQVARLGFGTIGTMLYLAFKVTTAALALIALVPMTISLGIAKLLSSQHTSKIQEKTSYLAKHVGVNLSYTAFTVVISIPVSVVWKSVVVASDVVGILIPSTGKWARATNTKLIDRLSPRGNAVVKPQAVLISNYFFKRIIQAAFAPSTRYVRNGVI
jgi:hypothetical protein